MRTALHQIEYLVNDKWSLEQFYIFLVLTRTSLVLVSAKVWLPTAFITLPVKESNPLKTSFLDFSQNSDISIFTKSFLIAKTP